MTDPQTEARAIARRLWKEHGGGQHGPHVETLTMPLSKFGGFVDVFVATALAAKDAELATIKLAQEANHNLAVANGNRAREEYRRAERAEAQLAEARKALEPFARIAEAEDFAGTKDGESIFVNVTLCRAARRALEAQGGENGQ